MGVIRWAKERLVNWMVKDIYIREAKFGTGTVRLGNILTFPVVENHPPLGDGQVGFKADVVPGPGEDRIQYWDRDPGVARSVAHTGELGWQPIDTQEVTGIDGTLSFSSIPQTFDHLKILIQVRSPLATFGLSTGSMRFNTDTTTNYRSVMSWLQNNGAWVNSGADGLQNGFAWGVIPSANASTDLSAFEMTIPGYTNSQNKAWTAHGGALASSGVTQFARAVSMGRWSQIAAITDIEIGRSISPAAMMTALQVGSRASLYGLVEA